MTGDWGRFLTSAQRLTCRRLIVATDALPGNHATEGWTIYQYPHLSTAQYLELRYRRQDGKLARWVIERDGSVSANNDFGRLQTLEPIA